MFMHYHHEMTQVRLSTESLAFSMVEGIGGQRGSSWLSDSIAVTNQINNTDLGRKIQKHGVCYNATFTGR